MLMKAGGINRDRSERLDDLALVRIARSRTKETGILVDLDALSSRLPHLQRAREFARDGKALNRNDH
jgi:hypothetical protein